MQAYSIEYKVRGKDRKYDVLIDARDMKSAKRKLGKKHGYKDGRMIQIIRTFVVGYY
jgi:hypothetical protein